MPWDAGNINILYASSLRNTRTEKTQQIAVPHEIPWISGKRQPPGCIYIYIYLYKWTNMMISGCYGILKTKSFIWKGEGKTYWWAWQKPSMLHNPCYLLLLTLSDENFGLWTISGLQKCQGASRCYNSNTHVPCVFVRSCFVHLRYLLGSNPGTLLFTAIFSC